MRVRTGIVLVVLAVVALALLGCGSGGSSGSSGSSGSTGGSTTGGTTVVEKNIAFDPSTLAVKAGDTVTFKNDDSVPHNVKIDGRELGTQQPGESKTWTASKAGSYPYSCVIHPSMTGEITVE
jgi:plastocyanin